jgi:hypothetical protein
MTELGRSFPVNKLGSDGAIELLLQSSHLSADNTIRGSEKNLGTWTSNTLNSWILLTYIDALALASRLDGLPLAIVIAGAFMRETGTSITEHL